MNKTLLKVGIAASASMLSVVMTTTAQAATFIGSYAVYDGPNWQTNPTVYSAREAAALVFGGSPTDYLISIDPNSITQTAWYDGWGDHSGVVQNQDYKLDLGAPGYDDPTGNVGAAYSAYVQDGLLDTQTYRNYVFANETTQVPEPFTVIGTLVGGSAALRMRKKLKSDKA